MQFDDEICLCRCSRTCLIWTKNITKPDATAADDSPILESKNTFRASLTYANIVRFLLAITVLPGCLAAPMQTTTTTTNNPTNLLLCLKKGNEEETVPSVSSEKTSSESTWDKETINASLSNVKKGADQVGATLPAKILCIFHTDVQTHLKIHNNSPHAWLRSGTAFKKVLDEKVPEEELQILLNNQDKVFLEIHNILTKLEFAARNLRSDEKYSNNRNCTFADMLKDAESNLGTLAADMKDFLSKPYPCEYIDEEKLIPQHIRHMNSAGTRYIRDWYIIHEYMNVLQYIEEVVLFYKKTKQLY